MKTTLELPDDLIKEVKLRAIHSGRKLKDEFAEIVRAGLMATSVRRSTSSPARILKDKETGFPVIECQHAASKEQEMTPQRVADILLNQEINWHHETR